MNIAGIIPARWASTRLPGKPLRLLRQRPLIQWVYENACQVRNLSQLIVATDDQRIYDCVINFGGAAILTPSDLPSGTDRCAFTARQINADIIVNIQGDEPFLEPTAVEQAVQALTETDEYAVSTVACQPVTEATLHDPNVVKVLVNRRDEAIYFSRQNLPYIRDAEPLNMQDHPALIHIGLYVYRRGFLLNFSHLPASRLEQLEKLEQLRLIENGIPIKVVRSATPSLGIDTEADLQKAEQILSTYEDRTRN